MFLFRVRESDEDQKSTTASRAGVMFRVPSGAQHTLQVKKKAGESEACMH